MLFRGPVKAAHHAEPQSALPILLHGMRCPAAAVKAAVDQPQWTGRVCSCAALACITQAAGTMNGTLAFREHRPGCKCPMTRHDSWMQDMQNIKWTAVAGISFEMENAWSSKLEQAWPWTETAAICSRLDR